MIFGEKRHHGAGVAFRIGVDDCGRLGADGGAGGVEQVRHGSVGVGQSWKEDVSGTCGVMVSGKSAWEDLVNGWMVGVVHDVR